MNLLVAAVLGILFATGTFLVLRRDLVRMIFGLGIIAQATNIYLVAMGGFATRRPPVLTGDLPEGAYVDPIPQALVLTAIVIGLGVTAFVLVLAYRLHEEWGTSDQEEID